MFDAKELVLREFEDDDVKLLEGWLSKRHVERWFEHKEAWINEVKGRKGEFSFIRHFIVEYEKKPIGFCQYYDYLLGGETIHGDASPKGAYGIDYLIGEENYLGRGLGTAMVKELVKRTFSETFAEKIFAHIASDNLVSRRTLLSAGFSHDEKNLFYYYVK